MSNDGKKEDVWGEQFNPALTHVACRVPSQVTRRVKRTTRFDDNHQLDLGEKYVCYLSSRQIQTCTRTYQIGRIGSCEMLICFVEIGCLFAQTQTSASEFTEYAFTSFQLISNRVFAAFILDVRARYPLESSLDPALKLPQDDEIANSWRARALILEDENKILKRKLVIETAGKPSITQMCISMFRIHNFDIFFKIPAYTKL